MAIRIFSNFLIEHTVECEKLRIFLLLRFYMKSILKNLEVLKLPYLQLCSFGNVQPSKSANIYRKSKFRASQFVKKAHFALQESPKLISRQI